VGILEMIDLEKIDLDCSQKCGTCGNWDNFFGKCLSNIHKQFSTQENSICFYIPSQWRQRKFNPEASLQRLRDKAHDIAGIDRDQLPLSLQSKIDLLELKLKTLVEQLKVEKRRADLYEQSNIESEEG
jgi:hypothetical protein